VRLLARYFKQVTWLVITEVRSESFGWLQSAVTTTHIIWRSVMWVLSYFWSLSVVSHAFSVLCVCSKFGHYPHPLGYHCAKFCFFRGLHCWLVHESKIAYSVTHSVTQLVWCPMNRSFRFGTVVIIYKLRFTTYVT